MIPFGYLLIALGLYFGRSVAVGRASDTFSDLKDYVLALSQEDWATVESIAARRGKFALETGEVVTEVPTEQLAGLERAQLLGRQAKGYRMGATGPDYYDCSGLVWRVVTQLGLYAGPRFTTHTMKNPLQSFSMAHPGPPVSGDIVLWDKGGGADEGHTGFYVGNGKYYSAYNTKKGITLEEMKGTTEKYGEPSFHTITTKMLGQTV